MSGLLSTRGRIVIFESHLVVYFAYIKVPLLYYIVKCVGSYKEKGELLWDQCIGEGALVCSSADTVEKDLGPQYQT